MSQIITQKNIDELLDPYLGATTLDTSSRMTDTLPALLEASKRLAFTRAENTSTGVEQNFECCNNFTPHSVWVAVAKAFAEFLNIGFAEVGQSELLWRPIEFNDLAVHRYGRTTPEKPFGITPHRDQSYYINLIAVMVLHGPTSFFISQNKWRDGETEIKAEPGQIIVMRGGGFATNTSQQLNRPCHYVGPIDKGGRISFGFRQIVHDEETRKQLRRVI